MEAVGRERKMFIPNSDRKIYEMEEYDILK
jgi:hypothetical protein